MKYLSIRQPSTKLTLEEACNRFETWRKGKKRGSRIPKSLWAAAVTVCADHTVCQVSKALRLDYSELKRRVAATTRMGADHQVVSGAEFVEVCLGAEDPAGLCSVEMENAAGGKLKMTFSGKCRDFDPMELARVFWGGGR